jgi:hypothetical protein
MQTLTPAFVKAFVDHFALSGNSQKKIAMAGMNCSRLWSLGGERATFAYPSLHDAIGFVR